MPFFTAFFWGGKYGEKLQKKAAKKRRKSLFFWPFLQLLFSTASGLKRVTNSNPEKRHNIRDSCKLKIQAH